TSASGRTDAFAASFGNARSCAGFWTPASPVVPPAPAAGVQKAPGREVAGSWAGAGRRALWGFRVSGAFDGGGTLGRCDLHGCTRRRAGEWKKRPGRGLKGVNGAPAH